MIKYRKKPVVVEAVQFIDNPNSIEDLSRFMDETVISYAGEEPVVLIKTLEGTMMANVGDWIIKGVNGEFYPCKPDIFEKTYEMSD